MGQNRRKVKRSKPLRRKTRRSSKRSGWQTLQRLIGITIGVAIVLFYIINPLAFSDATEKSVDLYREVQDIINERSGVFTSIKKSSNEVVKRFTRYQQSEFNLGVLSDVNLEKLWQGFRDRLIPEYEIRKEKVYEQHNARFLDASIYYNHLPFCFISLKQKGKNGGYVYPYAPEIVEREQEPLQSEKPVHKKQYEKARPAHDSTKAKIAFVIDDLGNNIRHNDLYFSLPKEVTPSILPQLNYSEYLSQEFRQRGYDVMIHIPLEALNAAINPGPGTIYTSMHESEIRSILSRNFMTVPDAIGANNHMGSRATTDKATMEIIMDMLKERNMFFVDSVTSRGTVAEDMAAHYGIPRAKRNVFIDNENDPIYIRKQIEQAMEIAKRDGSVIAIGHYRRNTLRVIKDMLPLFQQEGIELVRVKELLEG